MNLLTNILLSRVIIGRILNHGPLHTLATFSINFVWHIPSFTTHVRHHWSTFYSVKCDRGHW